MRQVCNHAICECGKCNDEISYTDFVRLRLFRQPLEDYPRDFIVKTEHINGEKWLRRQGDISLVRIEIQIDFEENNKKP